MKERPPMLLVCEGVFLLRIILQDLRGILPIGFFLVYEKVNCTDQNIFK